MYNTSEGKHNFINYPFKTWNYWLFEKSFFWLRLHLKVKAIWWLSCTAFIEVPQDFKIMLFKIFLDLVNSIMWKETQCGWGMLDWILHVKTNALWKNVDYNASLSGNNLNTILVQKEATVVLERNFFFRAVFSRKNKILPF